MFKLATLFLSVLPTNLTAFLSIEAVLNYAISVLCENLSRID